MALYPEPRLLPVGDQSLIVEFGDGIDLEVNRRAVAFARRVRESALPFVVDAVPSFTAVGIQYRIEALDRASNALPLEQVERAIRALLAEPIDAGLASARVVEIPVCYGGEHGADLADVAAHRGLTPEEIARRHAATEAHVFMIGFAPGHPYIGLWDEAFDVPRRSTPRIRVPAGSVAIANRQTVIYPFELPGGWSLIGRTPLRLFDPRRERPCLLEPGDRVRFVAIDADRFTQLREAQA